jgi:hypothetical protein
MHVGEEQLRTIELDAMRDADVADVPTGTRRPDRLPNRLLGADALEHGVGADIVGQLHDARDAVVTALGDDVSRAELASEPLFPDELPLRDEPRRRVKQPDGNE